MHTFRGFVVADATVKTFGEKSSVVNFTIAENTRVKGADGNWTNHAVFVECADWYRQKTAPYLIKGAFVEVSGRLGISAFLKKDGQPGAVNTLNVVDIGFLFPPRKDGATESESDAVVPDEDLPF